MSRQRPRPPVVLRDSAPWVGDDGPLGFRMFDHIREQVAAMSMPVRCSHCSGIYDAGAVEVTARYLDCSVWAAPCCGRTVDSRGTGWGGRGDYTELSR